MKKTDVEVYQEALDDTLESITASLAHKNKEYASQGDPYHNFDTAALIKGESPALALWGMYAKHLVSIQDMVQSGDKYPDEYIDEKINDSINYHILLKGILKR